VEYLSSTNFIYELLTSVRRLIVAVGVMLLTPRTVLLALFNVRITLDEREAIMAHPILGKRIEVEVTMMNRESLPVLFIFHRICQTRKHHKTSKGSTPDCILKMLVSGHSRLMSEAR
jgi:hypothetical protein